MSYRRFVVPCLISLLALGCEDPPKPEAKPAASAAPAAAPTPSAAPTPTPEPVAEKPKKPKKQLSDCDKGPVIKIDNPGVEAAIRLKLPKPEGDITIADLKRLKSFNGQAARIK